MSTFNHFSTLLDYLLFFVYDICFRMTMNFFFLVNRMTMEFEFMCMINTNSYYF